MKWLVMTWLAGFALAICVFVAPSLRIGLYVGSALYLIAVVILCVAYAKELNANVRWMEEQLATVRYGTVTERPPPLV